MPGVSSAARGASLLGTSAKISASCRSEAPSISAPKRISDAFFAAAAYAQITGYGFPGNTGPIFTPHSPTDLPALFNAMKNCAPALTQARLMQTKFPLKNDF